MRALFACSVFVLPAGCASLGHHSGVIASGECGPNVPSTVIRTRGEFEDFIGHARASRGGSASGGLVEQLDAGHPDFDRQVVVLVRHDASSDSSYGFNVADCRGTLVCSIRTRRQGVLRDFTPHWFAVVVERPEPERVEILVDGEPLATAR